MLKHILKILCVFCDRREKQLAFRALYEKGLEQRRVRAALLRWKSWHEQLRRFA